MKRNLQHLAAVAAVALMPFAALADDLADLPPAPPSNTVPEPGSLALAGMALGLAVASRLRRARRKSDASAD